MEKLKLQIIISRLLLFWFCIFLVSIHEAVINIWARFYHWWNEHFRGDKMFLFFFFISSAGCSATKSFATKFLQRKSIRSNWFLFHFREFVQFYRSRYMVKITIVFEWIKITYVSEHRSNSLTFLFFFSFVFNCFPDGRKRSFSQQHTIWKRFKCIFSWIFYSFNVGPEIPGNSPNTTTTIRIKFIALCVCVLLFFHIAAADRCEDV